MDDRRYEELNGCYAMLCEALRAWHRMQKDHPRETAAKVLKDVYGYEFHLNGGGCPWRLPSSDIECTVYRNDRRVHVTIHADDSNRLGLYDTDGKALLANGKDE